MADWLDGQTSLDVRLAQPQDIPMPGKVYVAGREGHLVLNESRQLDYTLEPSNSSYMPCIDLFFTSVAENWKGRVAGVVLTGMGRDGAEGLKLIRDMGGLTIAQDRKSSIVYGMPKAAFEINAAVEILPLSEIALALAKFSDRQRRNV